jgi:endonuclease I
MTPSWVAFCVGALGALSRQASSETAARFAGSWASECIEESFYASVNSSLLVNATDAAIVRAVRKQFRDLVKTRHNTVPYTSSAVDVWDALMFLDRVRFDVETIDEVTLIYGEVPSPINQSGLIEGWNREHLWPKSYGVGYDGPDTSDIHALRPADWSVNSARNNLYFDWCNDTDASCTSPAHVEAAPTTAKNSVAFQPPIEVRGDIARAMFYMALRYNAAAAGDAGTQEANTEALDLADCPCDHTATLGMLSTLLTWHGLDPVDDRERLRSEETCARYQRNRNPFVDIPTLVEYFFGTPAGALDDASCASAVACEPSEATAAADGGGGGEVEELELGPCDLAVVAFNSRAGSEAGQTDSVALLALADLAAGSRAYVTDNTYVGTAAGFRDTEGVLVYTVPAGGLAAGEVVLWQDDGVFDPQWATSASFTLSTSGDTITVYAGDPASSFSFALDYTGDGWEDRDEAGMTAGMGALPAELEAAGVGSVSFGTHRDNSVFR